MIKMKWITLIAMLAADPAMAGNGAHSLTVGEGFVNPLGFHDSTPTFSWKLPDGVKRQTAYRIEVKDDAVLWDSGWVESDQSVFVPYDGEPLTSRQRLEWRVMFRDDTGKDSGWSKCATFEPGLLTSEDWKAHWIRPLVEVEPDEEFELIKAVYRSKRNSRHKQDVTKLLQKKIKSNTLSFNVNNNTLGGDPAYGEPKELVVSYKVGGKKRRTL